MRRNKNDLIDYNQLLLGTIAFLNQYHADNSKIFLGFISQYLKSAVNYGLFQKDSKAQMETNIQIGNLLIFFENFLRFSGISKEVNEWFQADLLNVFYYFSMPRTSFLCRSCRTCAA